MRIHNNDKRFVCVRCGICSGMQSEGTYEDTSSRYDDFGNSDPASGALLLKGKPQQTETTNFDSGTITITLKSTTQSAHSEFGDARDNAAIILECSNMCLFKFCDKNTFSCAYCPYKSPDFGPIKSHSKDHKLKAIALRNVNPSSVCKADVTDLKCEICNETMMSLSTLFEHLIDAHNKPLNKQLGPGIVPFLLNDRFACAECGLVFDSFHNLNIHVNEHYPNFICSECGQSYVCEQRLAAHVYFTHTKTSNVYNCLKCGEKFSSKHKKETHMISEHNIFPYKCPYCTETFVKYSIRLAHLNKVHDKKIEYPCALCPNILMSSSSRAKHVRYCHVKNKEFACAVCGDMFVTSHELNNHMIKHYGEKKHQCQVCKKAYARKKTLTEHMRIHNNDRRFVCVHCGKAFVQKCSLKGHMKTHHPDADFGNQTASDLAGGAILKGKPNKKVKAEVTQ